MARLSVTKSTPDAISSPYGLYITMQWLREVGGVHKYHWGLFLANDEPPKGSLFHATDLNREPLDLRLEIREVRDPRRSQKLVTCLQIATLRSMEIMEACAKSIRLMDPRHVPFGEMRWTCRVWVKEVLVTLNHAGYIKLPMTVDSLERYCQAAADSHLDRMGNAWIYNDMRWLSSPPPEKPSGKQSSYYGPSEMAIDSTGDRRGPRSSQPRTSGQPYLGPKPMITEAAKQRYYGSKPMITETSY
ncbi:unnamed protein product [Clonostachys chloroleuca]|uniref:Uncharacterized protein n=1 Tax=Clonostachys chloroleuca TaxID=1926264 RepID=A0AA35PZ29_9HYPO|nr:unnamed protein product [Clonostachys chloroleuca]